MPNVDLPFKELKIKVPGHVSSYDLSMLVPCFGWDAMMKIASLLQDAARGLHDTTFVSYFFAWRRFMLQGAQAAESNSSSATMFKLIMEGREREITTLHLETALRDVYHRIADENDFSIIASNNPKTRATFWDSIRRFCSLLGNVRYLPPFAISATIRVPPGTRTLVLADLARRAGRLPPCASWLEAEEQALKENIGLLGLLRDELQKEFEEELDYFRRGQSIISDTELYSAHEIDRIINLEGEKSEKLGASGSEIRLKLAIRLFYAMIFGEYKCSSNQYRVVRFLTSVGGQRVLSRYLGATPKALHAAFVIILIDTGWNVQPVADLLRDPFIGKANRGKKRIRSVGSVKFRANSSHVTASLDDYPSIDADLVVRGRDGKLSGVNVIDCWLEMTRPLRDKATKEGSGADKWLWIWRERFDGFVQTNLISVDNGWWYPFLGRLDSHPRLGKLPISHRIIRKTVINIAAAKGVFNIRLPMALADHASQTMTHQYFTETTLHSVYAKKMRKFLDLWESVQTIGIEDAAKYLGISESDLSTRQQLGLVSGLDFALVKKQSSCEHHSAFQVGKDDSLFFVSPSEMEKLHMARLALKQRGSRIRTCNPGRWVRSWITWQVVIDGFCERLESSRQQEEFRQAVERVEQRLQEGTDAMPLVH